MGKNLKVKYIILGISALFLLIGFGVPGVLEASRSSNPNARVITSMGQIRSVAEILNANEGGYQNVRCDVGDVEALCIDIESQMGIQPVIHQSKDAYCAYTVLTNRNFYCIDSISFSSIQISNFPGQLGYCDGATFSCTADGVEPPPIGSNPSYVDEYYKAIEAKENRERMINIISIIIAIGFVVLVIYAFFKAKATWRRREPARDEAWIDTLREIISKKLYFGTSFLLTAWHVGLVLSAFYFQRLFVGLDTASSFFIPVIISLFGLAALISIRPIKHAWRNKVMILCVEAPVSLLILSLLWILLIISFIVLGSTILEHILPESVLTILDYAYIFSFPVLYGGGILFSLRSMLHRGRLNHFHGALMMINYLIFGFFILLILT